MKKTTEIVTTTLTWVILISVALYFLTKSFVHLTTPDTEESQNTVYNYEIYRSRIELSMEGVKDDIVTEIDNYIDSVAPESCLNGIKLFELCEQYEVDVRFAMAQAEIESHYGTKGIAAKTNIVWNVKTYDNLTANDMIKSGNAYKHPDNSIEPYLRLLVNDYLVNGKTEEDMFVNFVNVNGNRYATNEKYEEKMLTVYNRINLSTNLSDLLKEYKKYKMILS